MASFEARRQWFEAYFRRTEAALPAPQPAGLLACPCCGYPTLGERGAYLICPLCSWEDDGQDDPHAGELWGGPNRDYSLAEARRNFAEYGIMYRPSEENYYPQNPEMLALKQAVMQIYEQMMEAATRTEHAALERQAQRILDKMRITPQRKLALP